MWSAQGYTVSESALRKWRHKLSSNDNLYSPEPNGSKASLLTEEQQHVLVGWVLHCNDTRVQVKLDNVLEFISTHFGINMAKSTCCEYLKILGLTSKRARTKAAGYHMDVDKLQEEMLEWIRNTNLNVPKGKLLSLDFTYTGHRTDNERSYSPANTPQPRLENKLAQYTNCIVTAVFADSTYFPAILFTNNPQFKVWPVNKKGTKSDRRLALEAEVKKWKKKYEIEDYQIHFLDENPLYCRERSELVRLFFDEYLVPDGTVVLSDKGSAFTEDDEDIFPSMGFARHEIYKPSVHHWLSPNDNRLHGDDVKASLYLLKCLDDATVHAEKWFIENMQLDQRRPSAERVAQVINPRTPEKGGFLWECRRVYNLFMGQDARGDRRNVPSEIRDSLDGVAWSPSKPVNPN
jgi:transposase